MEYQILVKDRFDKRLADACRAKGSVLCVGLDPDPDRMPRHLGASSHAATAVVTFLSDIIEATSPFAAAFKFNLAFFEALGEEGPGVLRSVLAVVPDSTVSIADAKRGDIGNSASFYARSLFKEMAFDAVTVSPYMGSDSVLPFLEYGEKGVYLLVRTSNPGGDDFQTLPVGEEPLYLRVARKAVDWRSSSLGTLGFVVGASDLDAMADLRQNFPTVPFLVPGVGAQGGDADLVVRTCGSGPLLVNSSRAILYASGDDDYAEAAAHEARRIHGLLKAGTA